MLDTATSHRRCKPPCPAPRRQGFLADESGATALEYGLIVALLVVVAMVGMDAFGSSVSGMFNTISTKAGAKM